MFYSDFFITSCALASGGVRLPFATATGGMRQGASSYQTTKPRCNKFVITFRWAHISYLSPYYDYPAKFLCLTRSSA